MDNQPQRRFCTNCGQTLAQDNAFCVNCGAPMNPPPMGAPAQYYAGQQQVYTPSYAQAQDNPIVDGLVLSYLARRTGFGFLRGSQGESGCGCIITTLLLIVGSFVGVALARGFPQSLFLIATGILILIFVFLIVKAIFKGVFTWLS